MPSHKRQKEPMKHRFCCEEPWTKLQFDFLRASIHQQPPHSETDDLDISLPAVNPRRPAFVMQNSGEQNLWRQAN